MNERELRIGDREREAAISALGEHYVAGRITKEEYDERSAVAWQARTNADLVPLFLDLPSLPAPERTRSLAPLPQQQRGRARRGGPPLLPVLLLAVVVLAVLNLAPWPLLLVLVILLVKFAAFRSAGARRYRR